ncbi:MAG: (d)CMP kinase [Clostridium sp.]|jgi:cytidylate kinase|nr:(d)CMP kinase [Clostridium sp.]
MFTIAIDGPAGSGKSTVARVLAKQLGIVYIDTGAMYRAVALQCIRKQISPEDEAAVSQACQEAKIRVTFKDGGQQVYLNNKQVDDLLHTEEISRNTSVIARFPAVREKMLKIQQVLASHHSCVMDGRDVGTRVLPNANLKIYLTASSQVRAKRRYYEQVSKKVYCNFEQVKKDIEERDERDTNRKYDPLRQAPDAILVDSSDMTINEVLRQIRNLCPREVFPQKPKDSSIIISRNHNNKKRDHGFLKH